MRSNLNILIIGTIIICSGKLLAYSGLIASGMALVTVTAFSLYLYFRGKIKVSA